jgi:Cu(I)/Ag(I) efflux system membrane fusion protein
MPGWKGRIPAFAKEQTMEVSMPRNISNFRENRALRGTAALMIVVLLVGFGLVSCTGRKSSAGEEGKHRQTGREAAGRDTELSRAGEQALEGEILYYTCGMHPSVRVVPEDYDPDGTVCPICKMDLIPVYREGAEAVGGEEAGTAVLTLTEKARALAQVETTEIRFRRLYREINTVGRIDLDERRVSVLTARVAGRIDRLYADFTGQEVRRGAPLAWIYSPDLLTTQQEYLLARETLERLSGSGNERAVKGAADLVEAVVQRLRLWGINSSQIRELEDTGRAGTHMTITSPLGGTVIAKGISEGDYVREGQILYKVADMERLWLLADVYESDLSGLEKGQEVHISAQAWPGEMFHGQVAFIDPVVDVRTHTVKVRVDVPNPDLKLKPGMYVEAALRSHVHEGLSGDERTLYTCPMHPEVISEDPDEPCPLCKMRLVEMERPEPGTVLAVPRSAVLDTGQRKLVYVEKETGTYLPVEIRTGSEALSLVDERPQPFFALLDGLAPGMRVVTRAAFLIDSQSQITGQAEAVYSGSLDREEKKPPAKHIH